MHTKGRGLVPPKKVLSGHKKPFKMTVEMLAIFLALIDLSSLVAQSVKSLPAMQETWVQSLCQEVPLEEEMETHSTSGLEKSMDRRACWATVHGVAKSQTQLSNWHFHAALLKHLVIRGVLMHFWARPTGAASLLWLYFLQGDRRRERLWRDWLGPCPGSGGCGVSMTFTSRYERPGHWRRAVGPQAV